MKKFKKTLSLIATISMLATYMVAPITAKADTTLFSDDFEAHAVTDAIAGKAGIAQTIVDGYWETSATLGGDAQNGYKLDYDKRYGNGYEGGNVATTNKTLTLTPHAGAQSAAANLVYNVENAENYTFSVDVRNSYMWSQTPVSGIRMYDPENEANYYELALITPQEPNNYVYSEYEGALAGSYPPRFTKVEGAKIDTAKTRKDTDLPDEWKATAYSAESAVTMLHKVKNLDNPTDYELRTTWFTLTLTKIGDTICWSVFDKERNATVWEASFKDESPLFDQMGKLQLFVYGNGANNDVFFDNIEITEIDDNFTIPAPAKMITKGDADEGEGEDNDEDENYVPTVSTPNTPLYLFRDTVEGYKVYSPVGSKAEDIMNNVTSYATGYGGNVADVLVDGYWQTSALLGGSEWFNDYCVQYDEISGNGWGDGIESPIRYSGSNPDKSNKVIALQPTYQEKGQLCVLNLAKNIGDYSDFVYNVDMRNFFTGSVNPVAGIRIADPSDDTTYYELALVSDGKTYNVSHEDAKLQKPRFSKVKYGSTHTPIEPVGTELRYVKQGPVGTASGMYNDGGFKTSWFTLTLAKKGNTLYWRIYDKAYREIVWEDTYTDSSPLFDGMGRLQLFAHSGGKVQAPTFFDNIEAKKLGAKLFQYDDIGETVTQSFEKEAIASSPSDFDADVAFDVNYDKQFANAWNGNDADLTDNKVIWLKGSGKLTYTAEIANTYSVDLRNYFNGNTNPVMGIRLVDPDDSANYYELAILSGTEVYNSFADGKLYPPRFTKVKGAKASTPAISDTKPAEVLYLENGTEKTASGLVAELTSGISHSTYWYTLELSKTGNDISLKVIDKSSGSVIWSKIWTDENPLFEDAGMLQIFTYGGGSSVLVDNVKSTQIGDSGLRIEASWINESDTLPKLITADYDLGGRLISLSEIIAGVDYFFSPESIKMKGATKKVFLWDGETMEPLCDASSYQEGDIEKCVVTYPNFSTKAFTVSIDDGSSSDSLIMPIMKQYGIKGTFNLTHNVPSNIVDYKHENFEIANHTTHIEMYSGNYSYDDCVASIEDAHSAILSKAKVDSQGVIWPYRAPKNLSYWKDLYAYVASRYEYARETGETYGFSAPLDWMQWTCTAWSDNWRTYTDKFMATEPTKELQMLALAGHAFDEPAGETSMTNLCEYVFSTIASDSTIWKATNIELCKYIKAAKALEITSKNVYNPSKDTAVYMLIDGEEYVAQPQSYAVPCVYTGDMTFTEESRFAVIRKDPMNKLNYGELCVGVDAYYMGEEVVLYWRGEDPSLIPYSEGDVIFFDTDSEGYVTSAYKIYDRETGINTSFEAFSLMSKYSYNPSDWSFSFA